MLIPEGNMKQIIIVLLVFAINASGSCESDLLT